MSHSYRHNYVFKTAGDKSMKKIFNRRLRRSQKCDNIPDGNAYRKYNNPWDIADYTYRYDDFNHFWNVQKDYYDSKEACYRDWKKWFKGGK
jgi:hypothetical protein